MFDLDFNTLVLAQEGAAGMPGETIAAPGTTAEGGGNGAAGGAARQPFGTSFFILLGGVLILMFVMSMTGQRREKKKREALLSSIKKHDKVQTVGGVIGAIVEIKPDHVLKVDESSNTRITFARSSIQQVLSSSVTKGTD